MKEWFDKFGVEKGVREVIYENESLTRFNEDLGKCRLIVFKHRNHHFNIGVYSKENKCLISLISSRKC